MRNRQAQVSDKYLIWPIISIALIAYGGALLLNPFAIVGYVVAFRLLYIFVKNYIL